MSATTSAEFCTTEALNATLRSRRSDHGGMPVGALLVRKQDIADLRKMLEAAFGKFNLLGIDRVAADLVGWLRTSLTVHFADWRPALVKFVE